MRIYATRLYATFVYMQLFPGSQLAHNHCFSNGYMQLSRICNFFLVPEQLHITGFYCSYKRNTVEYGYMQLFFGSRAVAYNRILLYVWAFSGVGGRGYSQCDRPVQPVAIQGARMPSERGFIGPLRE